MCEGQAGRVLSTVLGTMASLLTQASSLKNTFVVQYTSSASAMTSCLQAREIGKEMGEMGPLRRLRAPSQMSCSTRFTSYPCKGASDIHVSPDTEYPQGLLKFLPYRRLYRRLPVLALRSLTNLFPFLFLSDIFLGEQYVTLYFS